MRNTPQCLYVKFPASFSFFKCPFWVNSSKREKGDFLKKIPRLVLAISQLSRELGRVSHLN